MPTLPSGANFNLTGGVKLRAKTSERSERVERDAWPAGPAGAVPTAPLEPARILPSQSAAGFFLFVPIGTMAQKRRCKQRRKFAAIPFAVQLTPGTNMPDDTLQGAALLGGNFTEDAYIISVDYSFHWRDAVAGEGPVEVGFHHNGYSSAELLEALDTEMLGPADIIKEEHLRRRVRRCGTIPVVTNVPATLPADGRLDRRKIGFTVSDGNALSMFVVNRSGATLTNNPTLECFGTVYLEWFI